MARTPPIPESKEPNEIEMLHRQSMSATMDAGITANCLVPATSSEPAFPSNPSTPAPITGLTAPVDPAKGDALLMRMFKTYRMYRAKRPPAQVAFAQKSAVTKTAAIAGRNRFRIVAARSMRQ